MTGAPARSATSATSTTDGYLYLTDRKSYMIISGGVNIYPQETENLLVDPPEGPRRGGDRRAQRRPRRGGQGGRAAGRPGAPPAPSWRHELIAFCRDHLAHFKCPRTVDFVDELPRLPDRQAVQAAAPGPVLGRPPDPDRLIARPGVPPPGLTSGDGNRTTACFMRPGS